MRSNGVAATPTGLQLGRYRYLTPTQEQESGAKQVVQAIANAEATMFDQRLANELSETVVTAKAHERCFELLLLCPS